MELKTPYTPGILLVSAGAHKTTGLFRSFAQTHVGIFRRQNYHKVQGPGANLQSLGLHASSLPMRHTFLMNTVRNARYILTV